MKFRYLFMLFVASMSPLVTIAQQPDDVGNIEVSGVRLGMSADEAMDALVAHYSINKDDFEIKKWAESMPLTEFVGAVDRIEYGKASDNDFSISLSFEPNLDREDVGYMVVSELYIFDKRIGLREKLDESAKNYGPHTLTDKGYHPDDADRWTYFWCSIKASGKGCDRNKATLTVKGSSISLDTSYFGRKFDKEWDEAREQGYKHDPMAGRDKDKIANATAAVAGSDGSQGDNPGSVPETILEDVGSVQVLYGYDAGGHKIFAGDTVSPKLAASGAQPLNNYINIDIPCLSPGGELEIYPKEDASDPDTQPFGGTFVWLDEFDSHKESDSMDINLTGQISSSNPRGKDPVTIGNVIYGSIVVGKSTIGGLVVSRIVKFKKCPGF